MIKKSGYIGDAVLATSICGDVLLTFYFSCYLLTLITSFVTTVSKQKKGINMKKLANNTFNFFGVAYTLSSRLAVLVASPI